MKINRRVLYWGVPVVIALSFTICLYAFFNTVDDSLIGGGLQEDSPDGIYVAEAANIGYPEGKDYVWYYEFRITRKEDSTILAVFRFQDDTQDIQFRQSNGRIHWSNDGESVRFGDDEITLWGYTIPKNKITNKAEMATPRKPSD